MKEIIAILTEIIEIIKTSPGYLDWSGYRTIGEPIEELTAHIERLKQNDLSGIPQLKMLFGPTGPLQELSIDNGWAYQFLDLAKRFDHAVAKITRPSE